MRVGSLWDYGVKWLSLAPVALMLSLQYFTYFLLYFWDAFPSLSIKKLKPGLESWVSGSEPCLISGTHMVAHYHL